MNRYFFEIVERAFDRFTWVLVVYRKRRRRVIARAARDYRTPDKAVQAARRLQRNLPYAEIVSPFPTTPDFTFRILQDVVPLPIGSPEDTDVFAAQQVRPAPRIAVLGRRGAAATARPVPASTARPAAGQIAPGAAMAGLQEAPTEQGTPAAQEEPADQAAPDAETTPAAEEKAPVRQSRARKQAAPRTPRGRRAAANARS